MHHPISAIIILLSCRFSSPFSSLQRKFMNRSEFRLVQEKGQGFRKTNLHIKAESLHTSEVKGRKKNNKFEYDVYDKPIVLIGCRGAGDELNKLASSYVGAISPYSAADVALRELEEQDMGSSSTSTKPRKPDGGIIPTSGVNSLGTWVLTYSDVKQRIHNGSLDKTSAIVIDFDSPAFYVEEGKHSHKLTQHLSTLIQELYEKENMLVLYVNVHPDASGMSRQGRERKIQLEEKLFIKYSDYEICVRDEGLDVATVWTNRILVNKEFSDFSSHHSSTAENGEEDIPFITPSDSFTRMIQPSTERQENVLSDIAEKQIAAWDSLDWLFFRLLARAFLPSALPGLLDPSFNSAALTMGPNTFFLSLSFPQIADAEPYIEAMCDDVDAMEFRVDLLSCSNDRFEVLHSLQKLRTMCRPFASRAPMLPFLDQVIDDSIPVVYTVRTINQAGKHPDDEQGISTMYHLLHLGLRSAVEVLDVESAWDAQKLEELLNSVDDRYSSQILGSHHIVNKQVSTEEAVHLFRQCSLGGRADGAKVVLSITDESMDRQAFVASKIAEVLGQQKGDPHIPHIGLILGEIGKFSRILNLRFTPVTHESLPFKAAPGQLTANEIMTTRLLMGILKPKKYGILGHNIAYSVSPAMQGAAFTATKLPHSYALIDLEHVEEFVKSDLWNDESFGGCSVTIPHKQAIIPYLDKLTEAAKTIGAVNTVIVEDDMDEDGVSKRILYGDNTDWKGIYNPLKRRIKFDKNESKRGTAIILGSGGTARAAAYAAKQLGLDLIFYNRTPSKAVELAECFSGKVATNIGERQVDDVILEKFQFSSSSADNNSSHSLVSLLGVDVDVKVVISTLPAAANFLLPDWFVQKYRDSNQKPVIFDVNYKPYQTALLSQSQALAFPVVRGSEMLWEQGVKQFELWTKRTAPFKIMKSVVLANCLPKEN